ncbi:MAG: TolC family protein [Vicinamibacterales bacterium]
MKLGPVRVVMVAAAVAVWPAALWPTALWPVVARAQGVAPLPSARFVDVATGMTVDEAVQRALAREPSLREARSGVDVARGMRQQAGLRPNPEVMIERRDAPTGMDAQTMASIEWPLELGRRPGRMAVADRQIGVAELGVVDRERRLTADVRSRYGAVLMGARLLDVLTEMAEVTRRQRDLAAARVDAGASPSVERDTLDVELGRLDADVHLQTGRVRASLSELRRLVAMPGEEPLVLRDTLEEARRRVPVSGDGAAVDAGTRPDVREAEAHVAVADARVAQIRRDARPELRVFGGYMRMDSGFSQLGQTATGALEPVSGVFHYATAGLKVTLPFNRNQGDAQAARAERMGAAAAVEAVKLTAEAERQAAKANLDAARGAVRVLERTRATARRLLDVVAQSHELGRGTLADVLMERRRFVEVERAYVEALGAEYDAAVMLNLAMGGVR